MATHRAIYVSSVDRVSYGESRPGHFTLKFIPTVRLARGMDHALAVAKFSMTYSWHNVTPAYGNYTIKYSHDGGSTWTTVTFPPGMYSYYDLSAFLHRVMESRKHVTKNIRLFFVMTTYKVVIELVWAYRLDLRGSKFADLIGFEQKIVTATEEGARLPNITNSIDVLHVRTDAITDSLVGEKASNTLAVVPTDGLTRGWPFTMEPKLPLFSPVASYALGDMTFYVTDTPNVVPWPALSPWWAPRAMRSSSSCRRRRYGRGRPLGG